MSVFSWFYVNTLFTEHSWSRSGLREGDMWWTVPFSLTHWVCLISSCSSCRKEVESLLSVQPVCRLHQLVDLWHVPVGNPLFQTEACSTCFFVPCMGTIAHLWSSSWPFSEYFPALSYPSLYEGTRIADSAQFAGEKWINIVAHRSGELRFSATGTQK